MTRPAKASKERYCDSRKELVQGDGVRIGTREDKVEFPALVGSSEPGSLGKVLVASSDELRMEIQVQE
jgi:hypothetical protein